MKVAIIFGRGIGAFGEPTMIKNFIQFLTKNEHTVIKIDLRTSISRRENQDTLLTADFFVDPLMPIDGQIVDAINECDIAYFSSIPEKSQGPDVARFRKLIMLITKPIKTIMTHENALNIIKKSAELKEMYSLCDIGFAHSADGYIANIVGGSTPVFCHPMLIDIKKLNRTNKKPKNILLYLGRFKSKNDPALISRMRRYLPNWELMYLGCNFGIGAISGSSDWKTNRSPYSKLHKHMIVREIYSAKTKNYSSQSAKHGGIRAYDYYEYDFGMQKLKESKACWTGPKFIEPHNFGNRLEYTQIESFALSLPIIAKSFANNLKSPEDKFWGEYDGPLVFESELQLAKQLINMSDDEWTYRTNECRKLVNKFYDLQACGKKLLDIICNHGKKVRR